MKNILFIFTISWCLNAFSQITEGLIKATDKNQHTYFYSETDPLKTRIYILENGLTVYLSDYKATPRIQTYVAVRTGSANDPQNNTGLAHYLEHILFKGTSKIGTSNWAKEKVLLNEIEQLFETYKTIPISDSTSRKAHYAIIDSVSYEASKYAIANEYDKLLSYIGASGTNAYTWHDQTVYVNNIPSNQIENWAKIEAERFSEVTPRLFHTELEAVYEEKNRGLDNDNRRVWEVMFKELFSHHNYGTQTTIGTIEHLKNPSITAIKKYFNQYYTANNMAICLSGDLDLDKSISTISQAFNSYPATEKILKATCEVEVPRKKIEKNVTGPSSESVSLAFSFAGATSNDALFMELVSMILSNSQAGLIDLNLNQDQKVLGAYSYPLRLNERSLHILSAKPKEGQTLDEVTQLLLSQLELIKNGEFPDWLLDAIITDYKLTKTNELENNKSRANLFVTNFIRNEPYLKTITETERLAKVTKSEITSFVREKYKENYVRINKRKGEEKIAKVSKPSITPILLNREKQSVFLTETLTNKTKSLTPVFIDYEKDISKHEIDYNHRELELLHKRNTENDLFELYYVFNFGTDKNKKLGLALNYLKYLGCKDFSASQLQQEFYKLGCDFSLSTDREQLYISLYGLNENLTEAVKLLEQFLRTVAPDSQAYEELVNNILKSRKNAKSNKSTILNKALVSYAKYGKQSPFTDIITSSELKKISPNSLTTLISSIFKYDHSVLYYGPSSTQEIKTNLKKLHTLPKEVKSKKIKAPYKIKSLRKDQVLFVEYDMVQTEVILLSKAKKYSEKRGIQARLFNEYFGGGMGSIVFQEMRESKALAYSVRSFYQTTSKPKTFNYTVSYIGTQADKLEDAIVGMNELLDNFISEPSSFNNAKESLTSSIETSRSIKSSVLFKYLAAKKLKQKKDINIKLYDFVRQSEISDLKQFHKQYFQKKPKTYLVIGSKENVNLAELSKYGEVKKLTLEEIFGY